MLTNVARPVSLTPDVPFSAHKTCSTRVPKTDMDRRDDVKRAAPDCLTSWSRWWGVVLRACTERHDRTDQDIQIGRCVVAVPYASRARESASYALSGLGDALSK